jgi:hypothetical protein
MKSWASIMKLLTGIHGIWQLAWFKTDCAMLLGPEIKNTRQLVLEI